MLKITIQPYEHTTANINQLSNLMYTNLFQLDCYTDSFADVITFESAPEPSQN